MTRQEMRESYRKRFNELEVRFFGINGKYSISGQDYKYRHVLSDDDIIINTKNVRQIKGAPVLIVGKNKAVYLKPWDMKKAHNLEDLGDNFYIVKLSRAYFKPYTFSSPFADFAIEQDQDFDYLLQVARDQDRIGMAVSNGFLNF